VDSVHGPWTTFGLGGPAMDGGIELTGERPGRCSVSPMLTGGNREGGGGGDEPAWDLTRERKAVRWLGDGGRWWRLKWLGEDGALSEEGSNGGWRRGR
jgi:hypothetical protein